MRISKSKPKFVMKSVKKSMALLLAMGSMAFCLPGLAQEHVYFSEDFPNGELGGNWNLEASTTIEAAGGPVYGVNMGDYIAMGWVWDLNGQMITNNNRPVATTQLNGRYLLTTVPFTMQTGDITNILSFGYEYMATAAVPASVRNFGVLVRQDGGEWDTVYRMFGETDSLATEFSGFQTVVLPEGYKGAEIELAFCFDAVHQGNSPYGFFISDVDFAAYAPEAVAELEVLSSGFACGTTFPLSLGVSNRGGSAIRSMDFAYSLNGGESKSVSVDSCGIEPLTSGQFALSLDLGEAVLDDSNSVMLWNTALNGEAVTAGDTVEYRFLYVDEAYTSAYVPVLEVFTASWCGPCATMNQYLNPAVEELKEAGVLNVVKFQQSGDRYAIPAGESRYSYYGYSMTRGGIPAPIYNGESNMLYWPAGTYPELMTSLQESAEADHQQMAPMRFEFSKFVADTTTGMLEIGFTVTTAMDMTANVVTVVTEGTTTGNRGTNGEREFHWVAQAVPSAATGDATDFAKGEPVEFTYYVDLDETNTEEIADLQLVCFAQNRSSKEMYQSASFVDLTYGVVDVANEASDPMPEVRLYPNPAMETAFLSGLENAKVQVFDMTGRMVFEILDADATIELPLDGFHAGTYVVRISQNDSVATRKLSVLR